MSEQHNTSAEAAKMVVRRNTEEVQGRGNFDLFEELFADDFVDHTAQPNTTPDKDGDFRTLLTICHLKSFCQRAGKQTAGERRQATDYSALERSVFSLVYS